MNVINAISINVCTMLRSFLVFLPVVPTISPSMSPSMSPGSGADTFGKKITCIFLYQKELKATARTACTIHVHVYRIQTCLHICYPDYKLFRKDTNKAVMEHILSSRNNYCLQ